MDAEDKTVARAARASVARTILDISELTISCNKGVLELSGKIKAPRNQPGSFSVRKEFEILKTQLRSTRGVREVYGDRVTIYD